MQFITLKHWHNFFPHCIMQLYFDILDLSPVYVWELFNSELHSSSLLGII